MRSSLSWQFYSSIREALLPINPCSYGVLLGLLVGRVDFSLRRFWNEANHMVIESLPWTFCSKLKSYSIFYFLPPILSRYVAYYSSKEVNVQWKNRSDKGELSGQSPTDPEPLRWGEVGAVRGLLKGHQLLLERSCWSELGNLWMPFKTGVRLWMRAKSLSSLPPNLSLPYSSWINNPTRTS